MHLLGRLRQDDDGDDNDADADADAEENVLTAQGPTLTPCALYLLLMRFPAGVLFLEVVSVNVKSALNPV